MSEMKRSWLIQRLKKPFKQLKGGMINPFSFGGGGSGFGAEAQKILTLICDFDYMGAAEFEDGKTAKVFHTMLTRPKPDVCFRFSVPVTNKQSALVAMEIIVICPEEWKDEVQKRITLWAKDGHEDYDRLKEPTMLSYILAGKVYNDPVVGWFELDNGFMFFTDPMMAESFFKLLVTKGK